MLTIEASIQERISAFMKDSIAIIQENIRNKPVYKGRSANASGKTAASLGFTIEGTTAFMYGAGHIFALEFGRKPTTGSGTGTLRDRIRHWIDDKGIQPEGISKDSLAFLIARKIHREGTLLYQSGQPSGTISEAVNQQRVDELAAGMLDIFTTYATSTLLAA